MGLRSVAVAVTGASGVVYGVRLVEVLAELGLEVHSIYTQPASFIARHELGEELREILLRYSVAVYTADDVAAPIASSSSTVDAMVVAPCSLKTLAAIAAGYQDNLVVRVADCMLRLRRPLVLVVRETPLSVIDLENMLKAARAGAVILPASPAFYHKPKSIRDLVDFIVGKVLEVLGLEHKLYPSWASIAGQHQ